MNGKIFVSNDYDKDTPYMFACTLDDHSPNLLLVNSAKKLAVWKNFIECFENGIVYYENQKIKNVCKELVRLLVVHH